MNEPIQCTCDRCGKMFSMSYEEWDSLATESAMDGTDIVYLCEGCNGKMTGNAS